MTIFRGWPYLFMIRLARDLGQRSVELTLKLEAVWVTQTVWVRPCHSRTRREPGLIWALAAVQSFRPFRTPRSRSSIGAASLWTRRHGRLLQPVGNGPNHNIAAQPWRVGPKSRRHSRRRSARLSSAKTARRSDTWLVLSGGLAVTLAPISGPFVASKSFWSRLAAAVRPCGAAAELARPPRQALRARSHRDHGLAARVATAR